MSISDVRVRWTGHFPAISTSCGERQFRARRDNRAALHRGRKWDLAERRELRRSTTEDGAD